MILIVKKIKENIIEVDVHLKLSPIEKNNDKNIFVSVELANLIRVKKMIKKNWKK